MALGVLIGLPCHAGPDGAPVYEAGVRFAGCLSAVAPPMNFQSATHIVAGKRIDHARNEIVTKALELDAEYLLFLDTDVLFPSQSFQQLLARSRNNDHPIVSGVYWSKSNPSWPLIFHEAGRGSYLDWRVGDYFKIWGIGMGLVLIRTDVFKTISPPWYQVDYGLHVDPETGAMGASSMTEDLPFCELCKAVGIDIYVDTSIQAAHFDKRTGVTFGLNDSMPQAQGRAPEKHPVLYVGDVLTGGEPAHVLSQNRDLSPTWVGPPDKVPTDELYRSVKVQTDLQRSALLDAACEWYRVTAPGGKIEVRHPDYPTLISKGVEVKAKGLYPPGVITGALEMAGFTEVNVKEGEVHHISAHKPSTTLPLVTILVLGHGLEDMTRQCVESIRQTELPNWNYEVVVIDNGSPEPYQPMGDRMIRNESNLPFGEAMTVGLKTVRSPYVLFLNNDTVVIQSDWLKNLLERIRGRGDVAAVGPKQVDPRACVYHAGTAFDNRVPYHEFVGYSHDHVSVQSERDVLALNFGCCLVRTELMNRFELDPLFGDIGNYEDVDWCLRVRSAGLRCVYTPSAEILHFGAATQRECAERSRRCVEDNRAKFVEKWKDAPGALFGEEASPEADTEAR